MLEVGTQHSRPCPQYVTRILARFGNNPYGQPLYRIVWGPSAQEIIGGFWFDSNTYEYRQLPRYSKERWVLEKWIAPDKYGTPESWERTTTDEWGYANCGPYPSHGAYETCHIFEVDGTFVPPEPALVWLIAQAIDAGKFERSYDRRLAARDARERAAAEHAAQVGDEFLDAQSPFEGPTVGYGGASLAKRADDIKFKYAVEDLPTKLTAKGKGLRQL